MKEKSQSSIQIEEQEITPKIAEEILMEHYQRIEKGNFKQRPVSEGAVVRYASDIKEGAWLLTPQPIAFDVDGNLIDGQHRLEAVRRAKKSIRTLVSRGWPKADNGHVGIIDVIDSGKPRTLAAMLHMHGTVSANSLTSTLRSIVRIVWGGTSGVLTMHSAKYLLEELNLSEAIQRILGQATGQKDFVGKIIGPLAFYYTARPQKALKFADSFFHMNLTPGSAIQAFYIWHRNRQRIPSDIFAHALCSTIRLWDADDNDVKQIKPTREAVEWLATLNPKLTDNLRRLCPRSGSHVGSRVTLIAAN